MTPVNAGKGLSLNFLSVVQKQSNKPEVVDTVSWLNVVLATVAPSNIISNYYTSVPTTCGRHSNGTCECPDCWKKIFKTFFTLQQLPYVFTVEFFSSIQGSMSAQ